MKLFNLLLIASLASNLKSMQPAVNYKYQNECSESCTSNKTTYAWCLMAKSFNALLEEKEGIKFDTADSSQRSIFRTKLENDNKLVDEWINKTLSYHKSDLKIASQCHQNLDYAFIKDLIFED